MRATLLAAAAIAGTAVADGVHMHRRGHEAAHQRRALQNPAPSSVASSAAEETCGCTTEVITYYGSPTLIPLPETTSTPSPSSVAPVTTSSTVPPADLTTTLESTSYTTVTVVTTTPPASPSPAPEPEPEPETSSVPAETPEAPVETPSQTPSEAPSSPAPAPSSSTETPVVESSTWVPQTSSSVIPSPVAPVTTPSSVAPATTSTAVVELPTPDITSFTSTGVYTIPAKTITVTDATTVCGAASTELPSGSHTIGGVTTVVETATTVTCPYATVKPTGSTTTSVIETTTYVCPSAGTYTIAPITTYVPTNTAVVYPTPATYTPGTYTKPDRTMTITNTDYTYVCPEESTTSVSTAVSTPAVSTTSAIPSSSTSSSTPIPSAVNGQMGMTYSPYANDGNCQDEATVLKNVGEIAKKGFSHLRLYATDCNGLEYVGKAAKQHGLKMIIGVYIDGSGISKAQEQVTAITKWAQWDLVTLIVVGNESIQSGYVEVGALAGFITSAKQSFKSAGFTGDVTTSESINIWEQSGSSLCSAIDVVGANIHPFFNAQTTADQAGKFAKSEVKILEGICPGKDVVILETGWPNNGQANGAAVPGKEQQATAIKSLVQEVGSQSVFFSFANDLWKDAGEFDVERYWGCIENFN